jgi:hypothetical protein
LKPEDEPVHILMGENYGLLEGKRKSDLENIVKKYAPQHLKEIENLHDLPLSEIPVIIHKILSESTRMEDADLQKVYSIVQLTGAAVHVPTISKKLNQFLNDIAIIFGTSKSSKSRLL